MILDSLMAVYLLVGVICYGGAGFYWARIYRKTGHTLDAVVSVALWLLAALMARLVDAGIL